METDASCQEQWTHRVNGEDEVLWVHGSECEFKDDNEEPPDFVEEMPEDSGSERELAVHPQPGLGGDSGEGSRDDTNSGKAGRSGHRKRKQKKEKDGMVLNN